MWGGLEVFRGWVKALQHTEAGACLTEKPKCRGMPEMPPPPCGPSCLPPELHSKLQSSNLNSAQLLSPFPRHCLFPETCQRSQHSLAQRERCCAASREPGPLLQVPTVAGMGSTWYHLRPPPVLVAIPYLAGPCKGCQKAEGQREAATAQAPPAYLAGRVG